MWVDRRCFGCLLFCLVQEKIDDLDTMKVEEVGYFHGYVKKILDRFYVKNFLICDEYLAEE